MGVRAARCGRLLGYRSTAGRIMTSRALSVLRTEPVARAFDHLRNGL